MSQRPVTQLSLGISSHNNRFLFPTIISTTSSNGIRVGRRRSNRPMPSCRGSPISTNVKTPNLPTTANPNWKTTGSNRSWPSSATPLKARPGSPASPAASSAPTSSSFLTKTRAGKPLLNRKRMTTPNMRWLSAKSRRGTYHSARSKKAHPASTTTTPASRLTTICAPPT